MPHPAPSTRRPWKRWTLKLALCTLAGAVVTWAVAWGCAFWGAEPGKDYTVDHQGQAPWPALVPPTWTWPDRSGGGRNWVITWAFAQNRGERLIVTDVGLPMRAMRATRGTEYVRGSGFVDVINTTVKVPDWIPAKDNPKRFGAPVQVLPLGFTLNTLLAASLILGLTEGAGAWRRRARRRKGQCPWCGYDRAGLVSGEAAACPECGKA